MNEKLRLQVVELMEKDIVFMNTKRPGWADQPLIEKDAITMLTPNRVVQEVKDGTDFGVSYAQVWMDYYFIRVAMGAEVDGSLLQEEIDSYDDTLN